MSPNVGELEVETLSIAELPGTEVSKVHDTRNKIEVDSNGATSVKAVFCGASSHKSHQVRRSHNPLTTPHNSICLSN